MVCARRAAADARPFNKEMLARLKRGCWPIGAQFAWGSPSRLPQNYGEQALPARCCLLRFVCAQ